MDWKNVFSRAGWTFLEGALGGVTLLPLLTDSTGWLALGEAALLAGLLAVLSFIKTVAVERLSS